MENRNSCNIRAKNVAVAINFIFFERAMVHEARCPDGASVVFCVGALYNRLPAWMCVRLFVVTDEVDAMPDEQVRALVCGVTCPQALFAKYHGP